MGFRLGFTESRRRRLAKQVDTGSSRIENDDYRADQLHGLVDHGSPGSGAARAHVPERCGERVGAARHGGQTIEGRGR